MQKVTKRNIALAIIFLLILVVVALLIGNFTYSFLGADIDEDVTTKGETTASGDTLIFSSGNTLSLHATTDNFNATSGNLTDTTNPSVRLIASSRTNNATATYFAGIRIYENTYTYSSGTTAEVILTVRDENGAIVTTSDDGNLTYVTVTDKSGAQISGFDITGKTGAFNIAIKHPISTTSSTTGTTHTWTFTLTFVNYTYDQSVNENATLDMEVILQKDEIMPTLADYIVNEIYTGVDGENYIYYHDGQGQYGSLEAGDNSYRYAGGGYEVADKYKDQYNSVDAAIEDLTFEGYYVNGICYDPTDENDAMDMLLSVAQDFCDINGCVPEEVLSNTESSEYQALMDFYDDGIMAGEYIMGYCYTYDDALFTYSLIIGYGENENYIEDISKTLTYDGYLNEVVKNYVCFGSDADKCPNDNLYRIIGVFDDQIKLIKADYVTTEMLGTNGDYIGLCSESEIKHMYCDYESFGKMNANSIALYYWSEENASLSFNATGYYNVWSYSALNKINLNTNFINYLGNNWSSKIASHSWIVGGADDDLLYYNNVNSIYNYEIKNSNSDIETEYNAKIGLPYVSDYGYAINPSKWSSNTESINGTITSYDNWMFMELGDWSITRLASEDSHESFDFIFSFGSVIIGTLPNDNNEQTLRPVFYLNSNVNLIEGSGTISDPYRIA